MGRPGSKDGSNPDADTSKPKRVRTGCLTCRERHLKCDEGMPHCLNCRKSSRTCRRGIRLNFMHIDCQQPPTLLRSKDHWHVRFEDNSKEIADEYKGGLDRYQPYNDSPGRKDGAGGGAGAARTAVMVPPSAASSHQQSHPDQLHHFQAMVDEIPAPYQNVQLNTQFAQQQPHHHHHTSSLSDSGYGSSNIALLTASSHTATDRAQTPVKAMRSYVESPYEALYMQVYVEEVAIWMDSLDPHKHALEAENFMLRNAMLACGAQHMWLVNENYREATAQQYYHAAVEEMMPLIDSGEQDELCAVTNCILSVYSLMCEKPLPRLTDLAALRGMIEKLRWNAATTGVGGACFWLNTGMDILSRLAFNTKVEGSLDKWQLNMDFQDQAANQREEIWAHRIMFLTAKVGNFRATASTKNRQVSPQRAETWSRQRYEEWSSLKAWVEQWDEAVPRSWHPLSHLKPGDSLSQKTWSQTGTKSTFPEIYILKRTTIAARLFYHTAMLLLAQTNPWADHPGEHEEMQQLEHLHAICICGIVAHTKDRGVASVAIRSLALAAKPITDLDQRLEIMQIFEEILKHTGWRLGKVLEAIQQRWGWAGAPPTQPKGSISSSDWSSVTATVAGQQRFQELVAQAKTDPLPVPPSRQPFLHRPRPLTSQAPIAAPQQQAQSQAQINLPYLDHPQHPAPLMRPAQASPLHIQGHHDHRRPVPSMIPSMLPQASNYDLSQSAVPDFYLPTNMAQANAGLDFDNGSANGHLNASHASMSDLNGYSY